MYIYNYIYIPGSSLGCVILVLSGKCASWKRGLNILAGGWTHISSYLGPIRLQKTFPPLRCTCQRSEGWAQIQPLGDMAKKVQDFRLENKSRMIQECQHLFVMNRYPLKVLPLYMDPCALLPRSLPCASIALFFIASPCRWSCLVFAAGCIWVLFFGAGVGWHDLT